MWWSRPQQAVTQHTPVGQCDIQQIVGEFFDDTELDSLVTWVEGFYYVQIV